MARWIDTQADLDDEVARIGRGPVAVDTEADSFHRYREKVCLVQLSFGERDALIDPLADLDLAPLAGPLGDPGVRTILHGADYDLRLLRRDFGIEVRGLLDTMVAARLTGERSFGLAALLAREFGVELDKAHQRADWSQRPLPEAMARYAVLDTRHLEPLAERLEARLAELGRTAWAEEELARLEGVRFSDEGEREPPWRRVKRATRLDRRSLAVLREVAELRERIARRRDVPPFRVMRDEVLLALAERRPRHPRELGAVPGLPLPWRRDDKRRERLLEAVGRALDLPAEELPERIRGRGRRPEGPPDPRLAALREARDRIATELDLEPAVVATRAALEQALEAIDRGEPPERAPDLRRWQAALLEPHLAALGSPGVP